MKNKKHIIYFVVGFLLQSSSIYSAEFFVTNMQEFNTAVSSVKPGDVIIMQNGTWLNVNLIFKADGNESDSIYLLAETPGMVILSGTSNLRIAGKYLVVEGLYFKNGYSPSGGVVEFRHGSIETTHSRFTNSAIVDYNPPNNSTDYKWISLYGTNNRVDHCYIKGKRHMGTTLVVWLSSQPNYHLIDHNYFGYRPPLGENGGETIRVGTSDWSLYDSFTIVEKNYFEECDGEIEIISNKSCGNIYRYNTFYKCDGTLTLRHGNRCVVESNFFLGENKSNTGGVRIIGEDHKVYNNYFYQLKGTGFRSALSLVNGIPDSPLNEYFQVKNAEVVFNTFVSNNRNFTIGAGSSSSQNLPPENCVIANNIVKGSSSPLIRIDAQPINMFYEGNIMHGASIGIPDNIGIIFTDPLINFAEDSLWRISEQSPAVGTAEGDYPYVERDIDGQLRIGNKDIGADQISDEPKTNFPRSRNHVGPSWLDLIFNGPQSITVSAGENTLINAVQSAQPFDTIELIDAGEYNITSSIIIDKPLTIKASVDLLQKPAIRHTNLSSSTRILLELRSGAALTLNGVDLDGMTGSSTPAKYLIRTDDDPFTGSYKLIVDDCVLRDVSISGDGNFFRAYAGTFADTIIFRNCLFTNSGKEGIRLKDESSGSGKYNVKYFEVSNSTFWNIPKEAIYIYGGDNNPATPGPRLLIDHCTFDNCGYNNSSIISAKDVDEAILVSSIFSNSPVNSVSIRLDGANSKIHYSDLFNIGQLELNRGAVIGNGMLQVDPLYADPSNGNFTLASNSPVLGKAFDFKAMGDLRWVPPTSANENISEKSPVYILEQNYPNPFNPSTNIKINLPTSGHIKLKIYDSKGAIIKILADGNFEEGTNSFTWNARGYTSGVYYYQLITVNKVFTKKMILLR
jgi:poly(beta-D-mannuronate) lyase